MTAAPPPAPPADLLDPSCALCRSLAQADRPAPLWHDALFELRHIDPPWGIAGWVMLVPRRHVPGPAFLDEREARHFGALLRHLQGKLQQVTGAERIYTAALGEAVPHLHCHFVPRLAQMPLGAKGWAVFDLQRAAQAGEVMIEAAEVARICAALQAALQADPPPQP